MPDVDDKPDKRRGSNSGCVVLLFIVLGSVALIGHTVWSLVA